MYSTVKVILNYHKVRMKLCEILVTQLHSLWFEHKTVYVILFYISYGMASSLPGTSFKAYQVLAATESQHWTIGQY